MTGNAYKNIVFRSLRLELQGECFVLSIEDCIALSGLTEEEIAAIAEHEHIPRIVALELGRYILCCPNGEKRIARIIRDDIEAARARGDFAHAAKLKLVLQHFIAEHASVPTPRQGTGDKVDAVQNRTS